MFRQQECVELYHTQPVPPPPPAPSSPQRSWLSADTVAVSPSRLRLTSASSARNSPKHKLANSPRSHQSHRQQQQQQRGPHYQLGALGTTEKCHCSETGGDSSIQLPVGAYLPAGHSKSHLTYSSMLSAADLCQYSAIDYTVSDIQYDALSAHCPAGVAAAAAAGSAVAPSLPSTVTSLAAAVAASCCSRAAAAAAAAAPGGGGGGVTAGDLDFLPLQLVTSLDDYQDDGMESTSDEQSSSCSSRQTDCRTLVQEARAEFDYIRFAAYRCAAKVRHIQKRTNLHLIDIWNVIEALRENGVSTMSADSQLPVSRLDALLTSLTLTVNKRLPLARQVNLDAVVNTVLSLLLAVYDPDEIGAVRVFVVKVALSTLCSGKLCDKLRYIFSQLSDAHGHLVLAHFCDYLRCVLALPAAVAESSRFHYDDHAARNIFPTTKVDVNQFVSSLTVEMRAECLLWLTVLQRITAAESVFHSVTCAGCERTGFAGLRYRCDRCTGYHLCQQCFWRGATTGAHTLQHTMQELSTPDSPGGAPRRAANVPTVTSHTVLSADPAADKHVLPTQFTASPPGGVKDQSATTLASGVDVPGGDYGKHVMTDGCGSAYCTRVGTRQPPAGHVSRARGGCSSDSGSEMSLLATASHDSLVAQLQHNNVNMARQIAQLRAGVGGGGGEDGGELGEDVVSELHALRARRGQLEWQLTSLQDSRRQLMHQLDALMHVLKSQHLASSGVLCVGSPALSHTGASPPPPAISAVDQLFLTAACADTAGHATAAASSGSGRHLIESAFVSASKSAPNTPASTLRRAEQRNILHHQQQQLQQQLQLQQQQLVSLSFTGKTSGSTAGGGVVGGGAGGGEDSGLEDPFTQSLSSPDWPESVRWPLR